MHMYDNNINHTNNDINTTNNTHNDDNNNNTNTNNMYYYQFGCGSINKLSVSYYSILMMLYYVQLLYHRSISVYHIMLC